MALAPDTQNEKPALNKNGIHTVNFFIQYKKQYS